MSDDIDNALDQLASSASNGPDPVDDALTKLANQKTASPQTSGPAPSLFDQALNRTSATMGLGPILPAVAHEVSGMGANIGATAKLLYDWAGGKIHSIGQADDAAQQFIREHTYNPTDPQSQQIVGAIESPKNPINWPGIGLHAAGQQVTAGLDKLGVPGQISTVVGPVAEGAGQVGLGFLGTKALRGEVPESSGAAESPNIPSGAAESPAVPKSVDITSEPVNGGLDPSAVNARAQILRSVGLDTVRNSALEGNAKNAATDFQMSKFDEPAGVQAKAQFDAERQALHNYSNSLVEKTGGTAGTDEDSLVSRGQTIAAPFDALRNWFRDQTTQLYNDAAQKSGDKPITNLEGVQTLLTDPSFKNTLMAKNQGHILNAVQSQLENVRENNPGGLTAPVAEQFRQWLNQIWTPENSSTVGKLKGAVDEDVFKNAGEDVYGPARELAKQKAATLDNPNGVAKLFDFDPQTPINRVTPYAKIPDTLTRSDPDQFSNVVNTLKQMPPELQPQAQAALSEIKAHLVNKVADAGQSTANQWNAKGVSKVINANRAKFQTVFADDPETLNGLQNLEAAGKILKVDQGYPGAAAQAHNALSRGLISRSLPRLGGTVGAGVGSVLGPLGAAGGAAIGESAGARMGNTLAEKSASKAWNRGLTSLSEKRPEQ